MPNCLLPSIFSIDSFFIRLSIIIPQNRIDSLQFIREILLSCVIISIVPNCCKGLIFAFPSENTITHGFFNFSCGTYSAPFISNFNRSNYFTSSFSNFKDERTNCSYPVLYSPHCSFNFVKIFILLPSSLHTSG